MNQDLQQQFIRDMLTESFDGLDRYDAGILLLEQGQATVDNLNEIFRVVHTLKGTAGCLGFHHIEKISHTGEHLLDSLRAQKLQPTPAIAGSLLKLSDALRRMLHAIEQNGNDSTSLDLACLTAELEAAHHAPRAAASPAPAAPDVVAMEPAPVSEPAAAPAPNVEAETSAAWGLFDDPAPTTALPAEPVAPAPKSSGPVPSAATATPPTSAVASASVRVDVGLLDKLMNLVGELVLTRNQLTQISQARTLRPEAVNAISQRLSLVTSELQEGIMKTRMQQIGTVWSKFPRIVRDIAHELGKQVHLDTIGAETELDRTIIESIRDPLTHIIRNSIDHGIESPAVRAAAGKTPEGAIVMRAYHEGGQVNIEIIDDGAGINLTRVRQKAVERGLISADEAARLSERDATNLIFLPGFSTAEKITNVSGRGVGMDVVKTNIEKIGGSVDIYSVAGQGTTLKIKIPLTLAIVPALIIRTGGERFAIPQVSLLELVRLEGEAAQKALEKVCDAPVFRLRGNLLPLVFLQRELKLPAQENADGIINIIVLQADQRTFGLVVDEVLDTEEIVVKPLGKQLKGISLYAGATIMGDGRVALILDALGLAQHARVVSESQDRSRITAQTTHTQTEAIGQRSQLLLFALPGRDRLALPLDQAARLEEISPSSIEASGAREAVQYRGRIMPLVRLSRFLPGVAPSTTTNASDTLQVIVYQQANAYVGLVVDEIRDIIEDQIDVQPGSASPGIVGSAVVQGRITDLVDIPGVLQRAGVTLPNP